MRMLTPYWTNRSLASDLFDEMDRFFDDWAFRSPATRVYDERTFDPACEVSEAEDHFLMSVDLPGMKKEDIKIELTGDVLSISGERKRESHDSNRKVQRYERSYGFFKRSFTLPSSVEADKVEARYEDGVLELYLPKSQAAKSRQIEIQSGKGGIFGKLLGSKKSSQEIKDVSSTRAS
jgi:HSP20 family protein